MSEEVCRTDDLQVGELGIFKVAGRELVVVRTGSHEFYALPNRCPHQGAPLGRGRLGGTFLPSEVGIYQYGREGQVLRCPWHRWEFDVTTGCSLHDPDGCRVASYSLEVRGDRVILATTDQRT
ncbi:MAG: Rieske 2Fe-2S domain-containing protein [Deltaproteobacteria bacterium]|nr:Rieske 2Fe-2S domain-containing protein [Deltaproteobacteria bacterium]MPZ93249.1 Rieske 2Fe-2S domain-containing protein [Actinomycetota bacterium]